MLDNDRVEIFITHRNTMIITLTTLCHLIVGGWGKLFVLEKAHPFHAHPKQSVAVVKGVEHISTIVLVNIWVARVRVPLVLSVGIWICKNSTINT